MKIIDKTYNKLKDIEYSWRTPSEKMIDTKKELQKLYNKGKGVGKRLKKGE